jgi:hypothetical protein
VQVVSTEAPTTEEYVPTPQFTQSPCAVAPVFVRYLPATHSTHEAEPGILLYFPATQAVHGPPSDPENPELQRQLVETLLPLGDCEFTVQFPQLYDAVAPIVVE